MKNGGSLFGTIATYDRYATTKRQKPSCKIEKKNDGLSVDRPNVHYIKQHDYISMVGTCSLIIWLAIMHADAKKRFNKLTGVISCASKLL